MAMRLTKCMSCSEEALYLRPYSGEQYCKHCYLHAIEKHVQKTITRRRLLKPDDRVAIALSGGKDSVSLIHIMNRLEERFPLSELVAITIDEGVADYRSEALEIARETCNYFGMEHYVFSFKQLYGYTLDEIANTLKRKGKPYICSYCGILRRKALNLAARKVRATKLATAHNLDDKVQSMVMNLLRGDLVRLSRSEHVFEGEAAFVPKIFPLCEIPEKDVTLYAFFKNIQFQSAVCPYLESSLRSDVRKFLNMLELKHPGMKYTLYRSFTKLVPQNVYSEKRSSGRCQICGEPTTTEICRACQTLEYLQI